MKRWIAIGLAVTFVALGAASAEGAGRFPHYRHYRPHYRSHAHFSFGSWPRYRSHYVGASYWHSGWSLGLSWWPSYRAYYVPTYPAPPQPQTVRGWYHPSYGFWCQCHGYQKEALPHHSYQYDTTKD